PPTWALRQGARGADARNAPQISLALTWGAFRSVLPAVAARGGAGGGVGLSAFGADEGVSLAEEARVFSHSHDGSLLVDGGDLGARDDRGDAHGDDGREEFGQGLDRLDLLPGDGDAEGDQEGENGANEGADGRCLDDGLAGSSELLVGVAHSSSSSEGLGVYG